MKVLQINSVCGIRSTGRICTDLAETLEAHGHECKIAYGRETVPEKFSRFAYRIGNDRDVLIHGLFSRIFDNSGFMSKRVTKRFIKWIKEYNPDIIHLHNIHGYYINIEVLFKFLAECNKPVVWTMHDCWAFTGHCTYFDYAGCNKWKDGCHNCSQKKEYPSSLVADRSKKNYLKKRELFKSVNNLTVVTVSDWLKSVVEQSFLKDFNIKTIYNGIDLTMFTPCKTDIFKEYGLEGCKVILGVASAWSQRKGLDIFIKLGKKLDKGYKIVLVGVDDKQKENIPDNILCINRTNNVGELAQIYSSAKVFINPSREETMGLTTVESLACGTPVIVSNKTALPECIDNTCGEVVDCEDIDSLYAAICRVCCDEIYSEQKCIERAKIFEKNAKYEEYIELYLNCRKDIL